MEQDKKEEQGTLRKHIMNYIEELKIKNPNKFYSIFPFGKKSKGMKGTPYELILKLAEYLSPSTKIDDKDLPLVDLSRETQENSNNAHNNNPLVIADSKQKTKSADKSDEVYTNFILDYARNQGRVFVDGNYAMIITMDDYEPLEGLGFEFYSQNGLSAAIKLGGWQDIARAHFNTVALDNEKKVKFFRYSPSKKFEPVPTRDITRFLENKE
jgi:hypothetical protein